MNNLILKSPSSLIDVSDFDSSTIQVLDFNNNIDVDAWISNTVSVINQKHFVGNIFIPLCFGDILSDFLGLSLAMHIRTSVGVNQISNLFLYGVNNLELIFQNEMSSILKIKGVYLIDYNKKSIKDKTLTSTVILKKEELISELNKIELKIPDNLGNNHSVANVWGMHRLLELEGISSDDILSLKTKAINLNSVYFKWLVAKNSNSKLINDEITETRKDYSEQGKGPKVLFKIDLSKFPTKNRKS